MRTSGWMLAALAACSAERQSYVPHDPCAALGVTAITTTELERDGIAAAFALWRDRGVAAFDDRAPAVPDAPAAITIRFDDAAAVFHGVYDPPSATIVINRAITDRATVAVVVAHELGHVFGLAHIAPALRISLMNPGNLVTPPTEADQRALEALWGVCP